MILDGCTTGGIPQLPPDAPSIDSIKSTWIQLANSGVPPSAMLNIGIVLDDQTCYHWFDQQLMSGQQNTLAQSVLGLGSGASAIAGGPGGLAAAGAMGLASGLFGAAQANSPTGVNTVADYGLTLRQRQAYQTALATMPPPATPDVAWVYLNAYHQPCTLSGIQYAAAQAKMSAPVVVIPSPTPVPIPVPPPTPIPTPTPTPTPVPVPPQQSPNPPVTPNYRSAASPYYYPGPNPYYPQYYWPMAVPPQIRVGH